PGALVFDAIHAAKKREADLLIVDTAGRMHVKANLMAELKKVQKIAEKESDGGPHEILLVLDATTGQNAVQQAKLFKEALPITGLVVTKLDGTAKGGVLFAVEEQISAPVKFIGVGEKMDDLMPFNPEQFLEALFADDSEKTKQSDYNVVQ
ncbi:MAG TPA: signal recognition particle-docking protein FtsY, partial [Candidatus Rifleibacterium sp.]|nr:signal recognition particle-docking protein FtsY [Candidatus Rifleibacterium sp.]